MVAVRRQIRASTKTDHRNQCGLFDVKTKAEQQPRCDSGSECNQCQKETATNRFCASLDRFDLHRVSISLLRTTTLGRVVRGRANCLNRLTIPFERTLIESQECRR